MSAKVKHMTAAGVASANKGMLVSFTLAAAGDAATAILYDNASAASGTILGRLAAPAAESASMECHRVPVSNGIYVATTGTNMTVTVFYE